MKKLICAVAAMAALSTGVAFADQAPAAPASQPIVLNDTQLDATTGGILSALNGILNSNSGLVNANVAVPVNVSNISLLSKGNQYNTTKQNTNQSVNTGNTGVISRGGRH